MSNFKVRWFKPQIIFPVGACLLLVGFLLYNKHPKLATIIGAYPVAAIIIATVVVVFVAMIKQLFKKKKS